MYFDLTEEQKQLRASIDEWLHDELQGARLMASYNGELAFDGALWRGAAEQGLLAALLPEAAGGSGQDLLTLSVIAQACGYHGAPVPIVNTALAAWLLHECGTSAQQARWMQPLAAGEAIPTFAFNEGGGEWFPDQWRAAGAPLSATKTHVERAADAHLFIVGLEHGALGLVERGPHTKLAAIDSLDRTRPLFNVTFDAAPCERLDATASHAAALRDALSVLAAADAEGAGRRALESAVEYAKQRKQFGRPIGSFQGLKFQLADMAVDMEQCFALVWYAAHAWDCIPAERTVAAARAKAHVCDVAVKVARRAVEAHGGIGYTWEFPLHVWLKRAMANRALLGVPAIHRELAWAGIVS